MKILITGINGQVGHALMRELTEHELIGLTRQDCDLTNLDKIKQVIDQHQPDLIINPAAYTKVDQAEDEPELAFKINQDAPKVMAEKASEYNIPLIHFSTDYVFNGEKKEAYVENDPTHPLGIYGQSKCAGEEAIQEVGRLTYIFRTSWVYSNIGHNFYLTMKKLSQEREELKVVADQFGVPTSNQFIAEQVKCIIPLLSEINTGIYHLVPDGSCSWHEFANEIIGQTNPKFNLDNLHPISTHEFPTKTKRPANSVLSNDKIKKSFGLSFNDWSQELNKIIHG
ncbi:dTDP-4-dehydrorhamnose reductase [Methylophilales bacterium MBRSG12]|uniref:dTDP-4-dehydrorhamnose reductase n=1 Tax=Methylophilales bacterium MBRS-H7 TaxID=1623450 RepID=A0A0H4J3H9_9PROT|nr:dTDP-4-dehydrorhamnose reductase [Methylophilales bacterium MBRSF5]AKO66283.1 dTDP-4-dehydrorhamnose reductase [Methylophilales bacterium MBRS-H7]AKO67600.1 dTDP-4-dehydrorhamnose reductase [Methylophilales bacterium MBRSG12]